MVAQSIVPTPPGMETLLWKATVLFDSGLLPSHIKNKNQVIAIDMMAQELNIPTWQALNGINVIQGKPTVSPQLMLALIERSGLLEDIKIDPTPERCIVTMKRRGRTPHTETFSMEDAKKLKSARWENNRKIEISLADKDNYQQQPAVMLKWRAISACARVVFPDVLMGMYTTEEIAPDAVQVSSEGDYEVVEVQPTNITPINSFPSKSPRLPVQEPEIIVTDGTSALQPAPEKQNEENASPNGAKPPLPSGDIPKEPTPSENTTVIEDDIAKWEHYQVMMAHESVKKLYKESVHRKNVLSLLKKAGAFNSGKVSSMVWRLQLYHQLRAEGHKEDEASSAAATAPDELEGFGE